MKILNRRKSGIVDKAETIVYTRIRHNTREINLRLQRKLDEGTDNGKNKAFGNVETCQYFIISMNINGDS